MNTKKPILIVLINFLAYIFAYYTAILLHEWGHGTVAWLYGLKSSPFDIHYGGWLLLNVDEGVNYTQLMMNNQETAAALIGIGGFAVTFSLTILAFALLNLNKIQKHDTSYIFSYWFLMVNMVAMIQYLSLSVFSPIGDMGRFIHGLDISPWIIFIPGTLLIIVALWRIFTAEIIKAYIIFPVTTLTGKRVLLLATLSVLFLTLYTHGYNPISDNRGVLIDQILAIFSILLVPILFILCNPSRDWVQYLISISIKKLKQVELH